MKPNEYFDSEGNSIKIMGLTGIIVITNNGNNYYVDSELLVNGKSGIAIFSDRIRYYDDSNKSALTIVDKKEILKKVINIFNQNNIKISLY